MCGAGVSGETSHVMTKNLLLVAVRTLAMVLGASAGAEAQFAWVTTGRGDGRMEVVREVNLQSGEMSAPIDLPDPGSLCPVINVHRTGCKITMLATNASGTRLYVRRESGHLYVVDTATRSVVARFHHLRPWIVPSADDRTVVVFGDGWLYRYGLADGKLIDQIRTAGAFSPYVDLVSSTRDLAQSYVKGGESLDVLDTNAFRWVSSVLLPRSLYQETRAIAVSADRSRVFFETWTTISVLDGASFVPYPMPHPGSVATSPLAVIPLPAMPPHCRDEVTGAQRMSLSPDGANLYLLRCGQLWRVDAAAPTVATLIPLTLQADEYPVALAMWDALGRPVVTTGAGGTLLVPALGATDVGRVTPKCLTDCGPVNLISIVRASCPSWTPVEVLTAGRTDHVETRELEDINLRSRAAARQGLIDAGYTTAAKVNAGFFARVEVLRTALTSILGQRPHLSSGYRTFTYQQHLWDLREKLSLLEKVPQRCAAELADVRAHAAKHELDKNSKGLLAVSNPYKDNSARHVQRLAVDVAGIKELKSNQTEKLEKALRRKDVNLRRPWPDDKVHVQPSEVEVQRILRFDLHSPVALEITSSSGAHARIDPVTGQFINQGLTAQYAPGEPSVFVVTANESETLTIGGIGTGNGPYRLVLSEETDDGDLYRFREVNGVAVQGRAIAPIQVRLTPPLPPVWMAEFGLDPYSVEQRDLASGDADGDGKSNADEFEAETHPNGRFVRFFAEGAASGLFQTRFAILNPLATTVNALLRFAKGDGTSVSQRVSVAPGTRATVVTQELDELRAAEFATTVESDGEVVVDRTMTWDPSGYGAHAETAVSAPEPVWYLAEGATHSGFDLFYLLQNPAPTPKEIRVRYLRPAGLPLEKTYTLAANSRTNIWVNVEEFPGVGKALASTDVSAVIESVDATPIIVERAMYRSNQGRIFNAGHESAGVTAPSTRWFLAEGATGPYFDLFVLLANPNERDAVARVTYLLPDGTMYVKSMTVPANSRQNIWVDYETPDGLSGYPLADTAVSTTVEVTNGVPIIVERSMWWPGNGDTWHEAHNSAGATETGTRWALADGEVGGTNNWETYVLVANTSSRAGQARVTLMFEDGAAASKTIDLAPTSRTNVAIGAEFPQAAGKRFGTVVESVGTEPAEIVVERAMYSSAGGVQWAAGTNALATKLQ
jgi:hypothetical protein